MKRATILALLLFLGFTLFGSEKALSGESCRFSYRPQHFGLPAPGNMDSTDVKTERATLIVGLAGVGLFGTSALLIIPFALLYTNLIINLTALIVSIVTCSIFAVAGIVMAAVGFRLFYKRLAAQGRFSMTSFAGYEGSEVVSGVALSFSFL